MRPMPVVSPSVARVIALLVFVMMIPVACARDAKPSPPQSQAQSPPAAPKVAASDAQVGADGPEMFPRCAVCHTVNAGGQPGQVPPLAGSEWVLGDARIPIRILLNGLQGPIVVEKHSYNNIMPAGGGVPMTDREIATILTYVRNSFGNVDAPVSEADVAAIRAETATRTTPWTSAELAKLR